MTDNRILYALELEYQNKQRHAKMRLEEKKEAIYKQHPQLEELDKKINAIYLDMMRDSLEEKGEDKGKKQELKRWKEKKQTYLRKNEIDENTMKIEYECPMCKDSGLVEERGKTVRCKCYNDRYNQLAYQTSNMLKLIHECNFEKFDSTLFDDQEDYGGFTTREFMEAMKEKTLSFTRDFSNAEQKSMIFYGPTGLGKSFLCLCIAERLIAKRKSVVYESAVELFEKLAQYVFSQEKEKNQERVFYDMVYRCDLLIIDDLGTEMTNTFVINQLFNIINLRAINKRKTIISTNLTQDQLQMRYEQRIFSRISSYYNLYKFIGKDIRIFHE